MIYVLYDILLHIIFLLGTPYLILKMILLRKYRAGIPERFGIIGDEKRGRLSGAGPVVWVHAVSVGETRAVMPVLKGLKARRPGIKVVFSTVTETGQGVAQKDGGGVIDALIYFPLDMSWVVKRTVRNLNPGALIVVEKEIWPNLFKTLSSSGVPVIVINGTISERSFRRYRRLRFFFTGVFSSISAFAARTEEDMTRAIEAGVRRERAFLTGNIKFGLTPPSMDVSALEGLKKALSIAPTDTLIVAGSTHEGEEEIILASFRDLREDLPGLKLVLAPRHPERFASVEALIKRAGLDYGRRSRGRGAGIILLDTIGELMTFYSIGSVAIVGGSLVPGIGGHNLLEPAYFGKPVVYGPYLTTYRYMAEMLEDTGGGIMVRDRETLTEEVGRLLKDAPLRARMGEAARKVLDRNSGSVEKTIDVIGRFIP